MGRSLHIISEPFFQEFLKYIRTRKGSQDETQVLLRGEKNDLTFEGTLETNITR